MRTAIFTTQKTTLTIETTEAVQLEQMSTAAQSAPPTKMALKPGKHQITVGAGVFKIVSNDNVRVSGGANSTQILSSEDDKDSGFPDTHLTTLSVDGASLRAFFTVPGARSL